MDLKHGFLSCRAWGRFVLLLKRLVLGLLVLVLLAACGSSADAPIGTATIAELPPLPTTPNFEVLDYEDLDIDVDSGSPLTTLQPQNARDEIDVVVDWLFDAETPAPKETTPTEAPIIAKTPIPDSTLSEKIIPESPIAKSPKTPEILAPKSAAAPKLALAPSPAPVPVPAPALEEVFAIFNRGEVVAPVAVLPPSRFPEKNAAMRRAAVLLPLTGAYRQLGADLQKAINLAVISLKPAQFEVIFVDTAPDAVAAAREAVAAGADLFIGPLFADQTAAIAPIAHAYDIPVLSFSNHSPNPLPNVWILGQQPEQELEAVLDYGLASLTAIDAIPRQDIRVAVVTDDSVYGHNLRDFSLDYLKAAGVSRVKRLLLDDAVLDDEAALRGQIRQFAAWSTISPAPIFDMVIICGDADFTLRVAPVLVWHDLDPAVIRFIGSSQWSRAETISEPSLEGGLYAAVPRARHARFQSIWQRYFNTPPHPLMPLGFDAVAVASLLTADKTPEDVFLRPSGFAGFSGVFRLYADGSNRRQFEVRVIHNGQSTLVQAAPDRF